MPEMKGLNSRASIIAEDELSVISKKREKGGNKIYEV